MNGHEKTIEKIFRYGFTHNSLDAPISWKNHSVRKNTPHAKPDMYKYTRFYYRSNRKKYLEEEEYEIYILSKILKESFIKYVNAYHKRGKENNEDEEVWR